MNSQWKGPQDGLPPVGIECEMRDDCDTFLPVEIIAEKDGYRVGWHKESQQGFYSRDPAEFRPIQSELDKLLNYAHNLVDKKLINSNASADGSFSLESIIEVLFHAGMLVDPERKPAEKMTHGEAWRALNDVLNDRRISMAIGSREMIIEALAKGVEL